MFSAKVHSKKRTGVINLSIDQSLTSPYYYDHK